MRKENIIIFERDFAYCIAGQLYEQAPNRSPRKADIIMKKALEKFNNYETHAVIFGDMDTVAITKDGLYKFINDLLKDIPEFRELNLSQNEYEKGIGVDDENRPKFAIANTIKPWKDDFIDLDAFIQNVVFKLNHNKVNDCFLCVNQGTNSDTLSPGNNEKCKNCTNNPNFNDYYVSVRFPKGKYTIACKTDCYRSRYICCSECDDKDGCTQKCDSTPDNCNNIVCIKDNNIECDNVLTEE